MRSSLLASLGAVVLFSGCASLVPIEERSLQDVANHNQTQAVAFQRSMRWAAQAYNSAQDVIQLSDPQQGTIVLKGVYAASRAGVRIPTGYTLTLDVRDNRIRFSYFIGEPTEPGARGPMKYEMDDLRNNYERLKSSILAAINSSDDF